MILYSATLLLYSATLLSYSATLLLYTATLLFYRATLLLYSATLLLYSATLLLYSAKLLFYIATLLLYGATLLLYSTTLLLYSAWGGQPEHIPVFKALLETTDPHQKAESVHTEMRTRSTQKTRSRGQTNKQTDIATVKMCVMVAFYQRAAIFKRK